MNIVVAITDDRSIGESLRAALPDGNLLLVERSVDEALRQLVTLTPDAIILDDSPNLGLNALNALLRELPATSSSFRSVPVVVLSAKGDNDVLAAYIAAGARACLVKPFQCDELLSVIRDVAANAEPSFAVPHSSANEPGESAIGRHQTALRWMSRNLANIDDIHRLADSLVDALVDIFDVSRVALLLQTNGAVRVTAARGVPAGVVNGLQLSYSSGLMRAMETNMRLVDRREVADNDALAKELDALGGRVALPLLSGGRTCGALVLGEKGLGGEYTQADRELLSVMARGASSFLEKSRRFSDVSKQQKRLDAVLANVTAGVITVSPDKTISMMNESAERILRIHAPEVLGRSVQKLGSSFADLVIRTLDDGQPKVRQRIRDGAIGADLGLTITPLGAEGVVVIFSIIPESEAPSSADYDPIWEYLSTRMAQEIKNPMVAINTFAQLLPKRHTSKEFREEFAEVVQKEVARINNVVETLFDFANHPRLNLHKSGLRENVEQVLALFKDDLESHSIALETEFEDGIEVQIDPQLFSKALTNVVRNSIEAMPDGGTLKIASRRENGTCEVIVSDTGAGVSSDVAEHIFAPFYSTKEKGIGLGLTMANKIVRQLNGNLELVGGGANGGTFAIHLPAISTSEE